MYRKNFIDCLELDLASLSLGVCARAVRQCDLCAFFGTGAQSSDPPMIPGESPSLLLGKKRKVLIHLFRLPT